MYIMRRLGRIASLLCVTAACAHAAPPPKDNPRLKTLFDADQSARENGPINWTILTRQDAERRAELRKMMANHTLSTGLDYYEAAFIEQHGQEPEDFLLAHALAIGALAKGYTDARWIAAATLDRYLQNTKHPQIFGTQTILRTNATTHQENPPTREPFDTTLVPDSLRLILGVPDLKTLASRLAAKDFNSAEDDN